MFKFFLNIDERVFNFVGNMKEHFVFAFDAALHLDKLLEVGRIFYYENDAGLVGNPCCHHRYFQNFEFITQVFFIAAGRVLNLFVLFLTFIF